MSTTSIGAAQAFRSMCEADKLAMKELTKELSAKYKLPEGQQIKLSDMIAAVTPGMTSPDLDAIYKAA